MASTESLPLRRPKCVLVLDGGCFRGFSSLLIIDMITKKLSEILEDDFLKPCDVFDLICGTGVGGLTAILLGRLRMDCATAIKTYTRLIKAICGENLKEFYGKVLETKEFFDSAAFDKILHDVLRESNNSDNGFLATSKYDDSVAKTFVTTVHYGSNRVYLVRSYPESPSILFRPPPVTHAWGIGEAIKASLGCPFFMAPLEIDARFSYADGSFAGFNSPVDQAYQECETLWGSESVISLSLGTSLDGLAPGGNGPSTSLVNDEHAAQFLGPIAPYISESKNSTKIAANRAKFLSLIKRFSIVALETREVVLKAASLAHPKKCLPTYFRLDPDLNLPEVVFCDVYYQDAIRKSIDDWSYNNSQVIERIVDILALDHEAPAAAAAASTGPSISREAMEAKIRLAQKMDVPKPEEGTVNPGYNPELDEKRPTDMLGYLKRYHVLFVIDDSGSMKGSRWKEARDALKGIADYAMEYNTDTIEVMFLNCTKRFKAVKGSRNILDIFEGVATSKGTPTGERLSVILEEHISRLDRALGTPEYGTINPLDIIVITDGRPTDDPAKVMAKAVKRMKQAKHHPNCIGVQFVQIGNDSKAKAVLEALIHGENGSMVDTVPYNGKLTPERLTRILLGGLHPNVRALIL